MKKLSITELSHVFGGYDRDECRRVQAVAATYSHMQDAGYQISDDAWDRWADDFDAYCV